MAVIHIVIGFTFTYAICTYNH